MGKITIRVYGIIINARREILLSDELALGMKLTKFPGGGLEYGEGTRDALKREIFEELDVDCETEKHFYTTDFFQNAFSLTDVQLISIYYFVRLNRIPWERISLVPFDKPDFQPGDQTFRFVPLSEFSENAVTLPIDKIVAEKLKKLFLTGKLLEYKSSNS